jgi:hypothetical protein
MFIGRGTGIKASPTGTTPFPGPPLYVNSVVAFENVNRAIDHHLVPCVYRDQYATTPHAFGIIVCFIFRHPCVD